MNGVHDLGGIHSFGAVEYEGDEPIFHVDVQGWEVQLVDIW